MTRIRIAVASLLAAVAVLAGGAIVHHDAAQSLSHKAVVAGEIDCCDAVSMR
jgi:hypothetical protein